MSAITVSAGDTPVRQRLLGFNLFTAIVGAIVGYLIGHLIGSAIHAKSITYYSTQSGQNDIAILLGYLFGLLGFLIGLGFANYPIRRMLGYPPSLAAKESEGEGWLRYFSLCTDHKVVGIQYLVGIGVFFLVGGLNAMLIRTELLQPNVHVFGANQYLTLVGMHGAMMMGMMTSGRAGAVCQLARAADDRHPADGVPAYRVVHLLAAHGGRRDAHHDDLLRRLSDRLDRLCAAVDQGTAGYDAYIAFFAVVGVSMCLLGFNLLVTIITMRAPGMTWSRLPIFVWSVLATAALMMLAAPMLIGTLLMAAMDRTAQTAFFIPGNGGSQYLYQNLFWVFGHPEVYIVALPGFGIVLELLPVFTRKPLWGYRIAVAGMLGVGLLSFFVWQHHLFMSGMNADLRPFFMLSTELISLPTGFIFLSAMGTLWQGRIRFTVPMLFCLGWAFNFLWGGISGVFLSAVPSDVDTHGTFFTMAHFHYTIMGGLVFTVFAAIYYWGPKMVGFTFNERLARLHFWSLFIAFNFTFAPLFALGLMGMPRRVVTYAIHLQPLNIWVSVWAFMIGLSMLVFLFNLVYSYVFRRELAPANPWGSKSLEWQLPTPVPLHDFDRFPIYDADPYPYGVESDPGGRARHLGGLTPWTLLFPPPHPTQLISRPSRWSGSPASCGPAPGCYQERCRSSSPRFCSPTSICACSTPTTAGRSARSTPRSVWASRSCSCSSPAPCSCAWPRASRCGRSSFGGAALGLASSGGRAPSHGVDDARVRAGQRRLRERVRRLDVVLRSVDDSVPVLDRDPGGDGVAREAREHAPQHRAHHRRPGVVLVPMGVLRGHRRDRVRRALRHLR